MTKKKVYICEGNCGAKITKEEYGNGLTKCGTKSCTFYGKPFKKVEESQDIKSA